MYHIISNVSVKCARLLNEITLSSDCSIRWHGGLELKTFCDMDGVPHLIKFQMLSGNVVINLKM
jgi:hypothetical protein